MAKEHVVETTIRLPESEWRALRALAERRAIAEGGRASASALIAHLIRQAAARAGRKPEVVT